MIFLVIFIVISLIIFLMIAGLMSTEGQTSTKKRYESKLNNIDKILSSILNNEEVNDNSHINEYAELIKKITYFKKRNNSLLDNYIKSDMPLTFKKILVIHRFINDIANFLNFKYKRIHIDELKDAYIDIKAL